MNTAKSAAAALLTSLVVGAVSANAQTDGSPWVELESISVMAGLGGQGGDGQLHLPNLGTNCVWPFRVNGYGAGVQVGVSKISASGPVKNLNSAR